MEEKGLPDFSGKVVWFYLENTPHIGETGVVILEYIRFEKKGDRVFLLGRIPELQGMEWLANCQAAIAWDSVVHYIEFKDMEDYKARVSKFKPTLMERIKGK